MPSRMNRKQVRDRRVSISKVHRTRGERSPTNREFAYREKCSVEPHLDVAAQFTEAGTRRDDDGELSHSDATSTNLLIVGGTHLYRDRLGTNCRDHAGCGDSGARAGHCVSRLLGLPRDGGGSGGKFHHGFIGGGEIMGCQSRRQSGIGS